jgi:hypothetical protein
MGNKMRSLKFDNKQYYFRNIFKNIRTNKIFKVSLFHKSRGTNNTIHIRACFFTLGKARGVPDPVDHHNQSMNLNPTDVYHSIFYGSIITGGTFNMNFYFGHPENTTIIKI